MSRKRRYGYTVHFANLEILTIATSVGSAVHKAFRAWGLSRPKSDVDTGGWEGVHVSCEGDVR